MHEPLGPIGYDHRAVYCFPKEGPEHSLLNLPQDRVVAAHDRAQDGAGLQVVIKDRLLATPDVRQPFAGITTSGPIATAVRKPSRSESSMHSGGD